VVMHEFHLLPFLSLLFRLLVLCLSVVFPSIFLHFPVLSWGLGSAAIYPSGVRGGAPAAKEFSVYYETRKRYGCNDFGSFCAPRLMLNGAFTGKYRPSSHTSYTICHRIYADLRIDPG